MLVFTTFCFWSTGSLNWGVFINHNHFSNPTESHELCPQLRNAAAGHSQAIEKLSLHLLDTFAELASHKAAHLTHTGTSGRLLEFITFITQFYNLVSA